MLDLNFAAPPPWIERGLCAQTDPDAFFPEKGGSTREAKQVCLRCDVRAECLTDAIERDERFGIRGGYSERERRLIKARPWLLPLVLQHLHDAPHQPPPPLKELAMNEPPAPTVDVVEVPIADLPAIVSGDSSYFTVPEYVGSMAYVLAASENHNDPLVRSIRKIAVQAITTLRDLLTHVDELDHGAPIEDPEPAPAAGFEKYVKPRRGSSQTGVPQSEIRAWAIEQGLDVNPRGAVRSDIREAYEAAHQGDAA